MDEYEQQNLQAVSKSSSRRRYHFLEKTLQLVLSMALLSYFLCHSTYYSGFSLFPHSFSVYFSTFLFSFLAHTLERKYMFLLCNGILAFLAKSSVTSSSSLSEPEFGGHTSTSTSSINSNHTEDSLTDEGVVRLSDDGDYNAVPTVIAEGEEPENAVKRHRQGEEENYESLGRVEVEEEEEEERESEVSVIVADEENEGESGCSVMQEEEEEGGKLGAAAVAINEELESTEELNRKFEEFIRKMKEEIRIEAQQQLIAV